jgi:hypothetical protein
MKNCLMYKLCYYRFDEVTTQSGKPPGFDTVRSAEIGVSLSLEPNNTPLKCLKYRFVHHFVNSTRASS